MAQLGRRLLPLAFALLLMITGAWSPATFAQDEPVGFDIGFEAVAEGFDQPVGITHAGDGSGVLYVVEKPGTIHRLADSERVEEPFLDITDRVGSGGYEQGLLGLAFPLDYEKSRVFYVNYTDLNGNTVVSRFTTADNDVADAASEQVIITQEQPYPNHNGGQLQFGPDGYLYIGLGDGGSGGDPQGNAQRVDTWLGKILRIEVDPAMVPAGQAYAIPEDNPFVSQAGALPEIFAYGLRNPWRFSFDAETGDMLIADVGQNQVEEINLLPINADVAFNFGWNPMEGSTCYLNPNCDASLFTLPIMEYTHDEGGCSVTGGEMYYGENLPDIYGTYIFGDFCSGFVWQGVKNDDGSWTMSNPVESGLAISSFGVDEQGEIYVLDINSGIVYRLEAQI